MTGGSDFSATPEGIAHYGLQVQLHSEAMPSGALPGVGDLLSDAVAAAVDTAGQWHSLNAALLGETVMSTGTAAVQAASSYSEMDTQAQGRN